MTLWILFFLSWKLPITFGCSCSYLYLMRNKFQRSVLSSVIKKLYLFIEFTIERNVHHRNYEMQIPPCALIKTICRFINWKLFPLRNFTNRDYEPSYPFTELLDLHLFSCCFTLYPSMSSFYQFSLALSWPWCYSSIQGLRVLSSLPHSSLTNDKVSLLIASVYLPDLLHAVRLWLLSSSSLP